MRRTAILLGVLCFFAATIALPASPQTQKDFNVAGNWDVTVRLPSGHVAEKWTVKQDGDKITGAVKAPEGDQTVAGEIVTRIFFRVSEKKGDTVKLIRATINDNNSMDGSITIGKDEYLWSATRSKN